MRWQIFWQQFWKSPVERLAWSQLDRTVGSVAICSGPTDISHTLMPVWTQQPVVLIGAALDESSKAEQYRQRLGLGDMTCLRFGPDRRNDLVQLYLPDKLPMPNTSQFKTAALNEIRTLLNAQGVTASPTVIVIGDVPLKAQFAALLAAEFGSRVQLESSVEDQGILVTGWSYWRSQHSPAYPGHRTLGHQTPDHQALDHQTQSDLNTQLAHNASPPGLLIIVTLPIPSLEDPLVAGRVSAYKQRRQDWFKAYLLPSALSELQSAIAPLRARRTTSPSENPSVVALLDNRVNHRSYGARILDALSPIARSSYINEDWFRTHEK